VFFQRVIFEVETQPGRLTRADSRDGADVHAAMSSYVWLRDCGGSTAAQMKLGPGPAEDSLEIIFGESFFAVFKGAIHEIAVEVGPLPRRKAVFFWRPSILTAATLAVRKAGIRSLRHRSFMEKGAAWLMVFPDGSLQMNLLRQI